MKSKGASAPDDADLRRLVHVLPTPMARGLLLYLDEVDPFRRVHRLIDLVELIVKVPAAVFIGHYVRRHHLDPEVQREVGRRMRRPALGDWWRMTQIVAEAVRAAPERFDVSGLLEHVIVSKRSLKRELDGAENLINFRNHYAHGASADDVVCSADVARYQPRVFDILRRADYLAAHRLVAVTVTGEAFLAVGTDPQAIEDLEGRPGFEPGQCYLTDVHLEPIVSLHPLLVFDPDEDRFFFHNGDRGDALEMLSYTGGRWLRSKKLHAQFTALFPWSWADAVGGDSDARIEELTGDFKGRVGELSELTAFARDADRGFFMVWGGPGVGKSALLAKLVVDHEAHFGEDVVVVEHFVRQGKRTDSLEAMLSALNRRIEGHAPTDVPMGRGVEELARNLGARLQAVSSVLPAGRKLLLVIDGLDEGDQAMPEMLRVLPRAAAPRVCIVYSSRPRAEVLRFYEDLDREHKHSIELTGLDRDATRALLADHVDKYALAEDYVEAVLRRSQGNPLYLKLLCDSLTSGELELNDVRVLPGGVEDLYDEAMRRFRAEPRVFELLTLLAAASDHMSVEMLADFFDWSPPDVEGTVDRAREVLVDNPLTPTIVDYQLFHDSMRDFLRRSYSAKIAEWERRLVDWCGRWRAHRDAGRNDPEISCLTYALRHYAGHLAARKRHAELVALLRDEEYRRTQIETLGSYEVTYDSARVTVSALAEAGDPSVVAAAEMALLGLSIAGEAQAGTRDAVGLAEEGKWDAAIRRLRVIDVDGRCFSALVVLLWHAARAGDVEAAGRVLEAIGELGTGGYEWGDWVAPRLVSMLIWRLGELGVERAGTLVASGREPHETAAWLVEAVRSRAGDDAPGTWLDGGGGRRPRPSAGPGASRRAETGRADERARAGIAGVLEVALGLIERIRHGSPRADALVEVLGCVDLARGHPREASLIERADRLVAGLTKDADACRALIALGSAWRRAGRSEAARRALDDAAARLPRVSDDAQATRLLGDLSLAWAGLGDEKRSTEALTDAKERTSGEASDAFQQSGGRVDVARALLAHGHWEPAASVLRVAVAGVERIPFADGRAEVIVRVARLCGDHHERLPLPAILEHALEAALRIDYAGSQVPALAAIAEAWQNADAARAAEVLGHCREATERVTFVRFRVEATGHLARVSRRLGRADELDADLARLVDLADEVKDHEARGSLLTNVTRIAREALERAPPALVARLVAGAATLAAPERLPVVLELAELLARFGDQGGGGRVAEPEAAWSSLDPPPLVRTAWAAAWARLGALERAGRILDEVIPRAAGGEDAVTRITALLLVASDRADRGEEDLAASLRERALAETDASGDDRTRADALVALARAAARLAPPATAPAVEAVLERSKALADDARADVVVAAVDARDVRIDAAALARLLAEALDLAEPGERRRALLALARPPLHAGLLDGPFALPDALGARVADEPLLGELLVEVARRLARARPDGEPESERAATSRALARLLALAERVREPRGRLDAVAGIIGAPPRGDDRAAADALASAFAALAVDGLGDGERAPGVERAHDAVAQCVEAGRRLDEAGQALLLRRLAPEVARLADPVARALAQARVAGGLASAPAVERGELLAASLDGARAIDNENLRVDILREVTEAAARLDRATAAASIRSLEAAAGEVTGGRRQGTLQIAIVAAAREVGEDEVAERLAGAVAALARGADRPSVRAELLVGLHRAGAATPAGPLAEVRSAIDEVEQVGLRLELLREVAGLWLRSGNEEGAAGALQTIVDTAARAGSERAREEALAFVAATCVELRAGQGPLRLLRRVTELTRGLTAARRRRRVLAACAQACPEVSVALVVEALGCVVRAAGSLARGADRAAILETVVEAAECLDASDQAVPVLELVLHALRELDDEAAAPLAARTVRALARWRGVVRVIAHVQGLQSAEARLRSAAALAAIAVASDTGAARRTQLVRVLAIDPFRSTLTRPVVLRLLESFLVDGDLERAFALVRALGIDVPALPSAADAPDPNTVASAPPRVGGLALDDGGVFEAGQRLVAAIENAAPSEELAAELVDVARVDTRRFGALLNGAVVTLGERCVEVLDQLPAMLREAGLAELRRQVFDLQRSLDDDRR